MNPHAAAPGRSLVVASDSIREAELIESLLRDDFEDVQLHIEDVGASAVASRLEPAVLVLGFRELERSERFYLSLYRGGSVSAVQPHRTIVLCAREQCTRAYELCRKGLFDDYVLFWPVTNDPKRLLMSIHRALRELERSQAEAPLLTAFAEHGRRIAELQGLLDAQLRQGQEHIESAHRAVSSMAEPSGSARKTQGPALEGLEASASAAQTSADLSLALPALDPRLAAVRDSLRPLADWAANVTQALAPQLQSARALAELAEQVPPMILIVEDDEFQRRLFAQVLESENYRTKFAASGAEALNGLSHVTPNLILMDLQMPDLDGMEVMRRCKATPHLAAIPIIMITGSAEIDTVLKSRKVGVADFIVKPFERSTLLAKVSRLLNGQHGI